MLTSHQQYTLLKRAEHFYKGLGGHESQISPIPPERYGDRFIRFISGITMSREQAAVSEKVRLTTNAAGVPIPAGSIDGIIDDPHLSATTSRNPSGTAEVMEKAKAMAEKAKHPHGSESDLPDRVMLAPSATTTDSSTTTNNNNDGPLATTTLPVIGEAAESASNSSPRVTPVPSREALTEPSTTTASPLITATSQARPPTPQHYIIGGRAPPTPPKHHHPAYNNISISRPVSAASSVRSTASSLNLDKRLPRLPKPAISSDEDRLPLE
jgi:1-phosphatidylinositol-4-phosphate 5-kinase